MSAPAAHAALSTPVATSPTMTDSVKALLATRTGSGRRSGEHEENERAHRAGPPRQLARKRSTHGAAGCAASSSSEPTCTRVPSCISTTWCPRHRGLLEIVGDQDHRRPQRLEHASQLLLQLAASHRVERAERLVEEDDRRAEHQRPHEAHPLPLPSRRARAASGPGPRARGAPARQAPRGAAPASPRASSAPAPAASRCRRRSGAGRAPPTEARTPSAAGAPGPPPPSPAVPRGGSPRIRRERGPP